MTDSTPEVLAALNTDFKKKFSSYEIASQVILERIPPRERSKLDVKQMTCSDKDYTAAMDNFLYGEVVWCIPEKKPSSNPKKVAFLFLNDLTAINPMFHSTTLIAYMTNFSRIEKQSNEKNKSIVYPLIVLNINGTWVVKGFNETILDFYLIQDLD
jgi:hypothetical protein